MFGVSCLLCARGLARGLTIMKKTMIGWLPWLLLLPYNLADNTCSFSNDGYCDVDWHACESGTDDADCAASTKLSLMTILERMGDDKTGKECSSNSQCPSESCKGNTASTSNCCVMPDGYCSYCEGVIGTGLCGSCTPGYFMDLEGDDLFDRYCTKCSSGKTTTQGYTQYRAACHEVGAQPKKEPIVFSTELSCDEDNWGFDCPSPGACTYDKSFNKDCTYRDYNNVDCLKSKCVYEKNIADESLEEGEQFFEGKKWESLSFGEFVFDELFGADTSYRLSETTWNDLKEDEDISDKQKMSQCINVKAAEIWEVYFCVEGIITSSHFEFDISLGVKSFASDWLVGFDPSSIEIGAHLKLGPGTVPTEENPAMCKFTQFENYLYADYMNLKFKTPKMTNLQKHYEDGALKINFLDLVPGKAGAIMKKMGLEFGLELQLDKLYDGGMQFSLLLFFGTNPFGGIIRLFKEKVNLVDLFQIPNSVDCASEKLSGSKCVVFGLPAKEKDTCSGTTNSNLKSVGERRSLVTLAFTTAVVSGMVLMLNSL